MKMKCLKKFIGWDKGKLFAMILALIMLLILAIFTNLQQIGFILKLLVMVGVIWVSVKVMEEIKKCFNTKSN